MVDCLAVGTHPDDVEIGMGGTLAALLRAGRTCAVLDLTNGEPTPHGTPELRAAETAKANMALGLTQRTILGLKNRWLADTEEARIAVAEVYRTLQPKILFLPYGEDAHPDHIRSAEITQAARFIAKYTKTDMAGEPFYPPRVFFYHCSHLKKPVQPSLIFDISQTYAAKREAVGAYHSQFYAAGKERGDDFFRRLEAQAVYFGGFIGARYGEPFTSVESLGIRSFDQFLP